MLTKLADVLVLYTAVHMQPPWGAMATSKTATLTLRIDPDLKEALRVAAEHEHRSIANMIEVLIRSHCERHGIDVERSVGKPNSNGVRS
ncbi:type II toxin-antitoxin system antitoxin [Stenotrophomonas maltophilia]|nr:ribbon-helix-helix protein, CopG family [Stenotrophomonas maltophilia]